MGAFSETAYEGVGFGLGFASTLGEVPLAPSAPETIIGVVQPPLFFG